MPDGATAALILLPFLAAAIERVVEIVMGPVGKQVHTALAEPAPSPGTEDATKRVIGLALAFVLAAAIAFGLDLDLITPLVPGLTDDDADTTNKGQWLTALALAGGSAPVHELIRLAQEAKENLKNK